MLKMVDSKLTGNLDIDRLKRLIRITRDESPLLIIDSCKEEIWADREQILAENENYFIKKDFDEFDDHDENTEFLKNLVHLIKETLTLFSKKEKTQIWKINKNILQNVVQYKILTGDYKE
jgi:hypothetical protein